MSPSSESLRVFLDSGVILEGCYSLWGASKGVLILAAQRRRDLRIVLAEAVEREVRRDLALWYTGRHESADSTTHDLPAAFLSMALIAQIRRDDEMTNYSWPHAALEKAMHDRTA